MITIVFCLWTLIGYMMCVWQLAFLVVVGSVAGQNQPQNGQKQPVRNPTATGPWWNNAVYYRILVDSFRDADGDGLGDIQGVTKQMSYVRALGADAIILSSTSAQSVNCSSPGITDHAEIDIRYGTLEGLLALIDKAKKLGLKVVVTLNLQSMSIDSKWFSSSIERKNEFEDRFLWREEIKLQAEKNIYDWNWNEDRKAFYAAYNNEAILNHCSEGTAAALSAAQCAWLRRGVSGVLLNPDFLIDPSCGEKLLKKLAAEAMSCVRSAGLETPVILVESSLPFETAAKYYSDGNIGANSVVSTALTSPVRQSAPEQALAIYAALIEAPIDAVPTWMTSTGNQSRVASRYGSDMIDAINLLALILPGAVIINQGDELGAVDTILEWASSNASCWPRTPHPWSSPFPWDDTLNAGFTNGEPWLPMAPNFRYANAKSEFNNDFSHVGVVRVAAAMRKSPAIGPQVEIKRLGSAIAVLRWAGMGSLLTVSNIGRDPTVCQLSSLVGLPPEMTVAATSGGSAFSPGSHVSIEKIMKLIPGETVLLAGPPRHCGGPGPVDRITNKLSEGWQKLNKYFSNI